MRCQEFHSFLRTFVRYICFKGLPSYTSHISLRGRNRPLQMNRCARNSLDLNRRQNTATTAPASPRHSILHWDLIIAHDDRCTLIGKDSATYHDWLLIILCCSDRCFSLHDLWAEILILSSSFALSSHHEFPKHCFFSIPLSITLHCLPWQHLQHQSSSKSYWMAPAWSLRRGWCQTLSTPPIFTSCTLPLWFCVYLLQLRLFLCAYIQRYISSTKQNELTVKPHSSRLSWTLKANISQIHRCLNGYDPHP